MNYQYVHMASIFVLFLFLSAISATTAQQRNPNMTLGSSLSPTRNSSLLSSSGQFAFGFYTDGDGFALGIWFAGIPQKTVIWTANRDDPPISSNATLALTDDGRLILQQFQSGQDIPIANVSQSAASASLLDSGNFVVYDSTLKIIWQTFDYPTDTLLPGQYLPAGEELVSSVSEIDHSTGNFRVLMQHDGNLVMYPVGLPDGPPAAYWAGETYFAGDNATLTLNGNGLLYVLNRTGINIMNISNISSNSASAKMYRATIDPDGIWRLYSSSLDPASGNWSIEWWAPNNRCDPKGVCGINGYCVLMDQEPSCICPPGFTYINQEQSTLGCNLNFSIESCVDKSENTSSYSIYELENTDWEDSSYSILFSITKDGCKQACLQDCNCEAALFQNQECRKQKLPLRFGTRQEDDSTSTLLKVGSGGLVPTTTNDEGSKKQAQTNILIIGIVCLTFAFVVLSLSGVLIYRHHVWAYKVVCAEGTAGLMEDLTLRSFSYQELEKATSGFKEMLGKGAFGTVFKGVLLLSNGPRAIAVKRLEKVVSEGEVEFRNEMRSIGRTHHRNLVQLLGYCHDESNRLLVYEYMSNGSLANFLFKSDRPKPNWNERVRIALDIARGMLYLHEECNTQIIHCDINRNNILMDENYCAKIADFGLAKLLMPEQTRTRTEIRGTRGYVAPEWYKNLPITVKADVYSYGVVFLEVICYRKCVDANVPENEAVLADWVYSCFEENELRVLVGEEEVDEQQLERMVRIGLWCIHDEPSLRPSMKKVVLMLEGTVEIPRLPTPSTSLSATFRKC